VRLDERKRLVLKAIIEDYIDNAHPVGSRTIARKYDLGVSPATIRNEMADLEEMGLIGQPHTSAGRVPTDKGYRYYVDEIMCPTEPSERVMSAIRRIYASRAIQVDALAQGSARLLSEMTDCLSLVTGPRLDRARFASMQLIPVRQGAALLVVVTDDGFVQNMMVELSPHDLSMEELQRVSRVLSGALRGHTLGELGRGLLRDLRLELAGLHEILEVVIESLTSDSPGADEGEVYLDGAINILNQPEFRDVERVRAVLGALAQDTLVRDLLWCNPREDLSVVIGEENPHTAMKDCSLVSATYWVDGEPAGRLAVLGPKRMPYGSVVSLVRRMSSVLGDILGKW